SLKQRDVEDAWHLEINGQRIADLKRKKEAQVRYYPIPPGVLQDGENVLSLVPHDPKDDIAAGVFYLWEKSMRDAMRLVPIYVRVRDEVTFQPLPARITIADLKEKLAEVFYATNETTAVRNGIVYTSKGETTFEVPEGEYNVYVTRGMEWSRLRLPMSATRSAPPRLDVTIRREVDTTGFIAADTHIHTVTYSKHGDASIDERMITIAAEGVELAVATDHNHHTDYIAPQIKSGLTNHFTPVTGNEVTTENGHFNAFPLDPKVKVPDYKETDWVKLISNIRTKGAKVVILNHPRWPSTNKGPFGVYNLNRGSGDRALGPKFTFDGMELINSATSLQKDPLYLFQDWFSLLNHGERITAVGSSDSHTVYDPVGQGRTYIRSSTDEAAKINVEEACANFLAGDTSISLGMFADVVVQGYHKMGQLLTVKNRKVDLTLRVQAPSWITPKRAIVFLNGTAAAEMEVPNKVGEPTDSWLRFSLRTPGHDAYLVCAVSGPGVKEPCWPTYENYTLAATNPVYLDVDGDRQYSSPRQIARDMLGKFDGDMKRLRKLMNQTDDVIALQMMSLARADALERFNELTIPFAETNKNFELYRKHLPPLFR
ncbi:MAG: CehA/McbA family metallohydrolase, partial [Verrucomicrobiales bacterium]|nr:CehA/McbA family metallohydrolase [Verrucomicrobiales bacterium]